MSTKVEEGISVSSTIQIHCFANILGPVGDSTMMPFKQDATAACALNTFENIA
jgi:hypothetical protein